MPAVGEYWCLEFQELCAVQFGKWWNNLMLEAADYIRGNILRDPSSTWNSLRFSKVASAGLKNFYTQQNSCTKRYSQLSTTVKLKSQPHSFQSVKQWFLHSIWLFGCHLEVKNKSWRERAKHFEHSITIHVRIHFKKIKGCGCVASVCFWESVQKSDNFEKFLKENVKQVCSFSSYFIQRAQYLVRKHQTPEDRRNLKEETTDSEAGEPKSLKESWDKPKTAVKDKSLPSTAGLQLESTMVTVLSFNENILNKLAKNEGFLFWFEAMRTWNGLQMCTKLVIIVLLPLWVWKPMEICRNAKSW